MVDTATEVFGRLDVLHNSASWPPLNLPLLETSLQDGHRTMAVTLTGVFLGYQYGDPGDARRRVGPSSTRPSSRHWSRLRGSRRGRQRKAAWWH